QQLDLLDEANNSLFAAEFHKRRLGIQRAMATEENRLYGMKRADGKRGGPMPVYNKRAELNRVLREGDAVIVTAGTGCGKSTQVPQYLADDLRSLVASKEGSSGDPDRSFRVCCTQPRRLAAQSIAQRVAQEYGTEVGKLVGFRVGNRGSEKTASSKQISRETVIEFATEGLLLHQLSRSPDSIANYDCIIIDEAHERNKETDLLLTICRNHLRKSDRKPLKVVVMSASIDPSRFCAYFDNCATVDCPGKNFPVEEIYLPIEVASSPGENHSGSFDNLVEHAVEVLFEEIVGKRAEEKGDVLIFLAGAKPISECVQSIKSRAMDEGLDDRVVAYPLYASMPEEDKDHAKDPEHRTGLVICCTNIAETSLTIDGVCFVLDGGTSKQLSYNHDLRCSALREERISQASAKQRRGRAGRTRPGVCFYLYSKDTHENVMPDYDQPQILRVSVDSLVLYALHVQGCSIEDLGLLDCPTEAHIAAAKQRLLDLRMVQLKEENFVLSRL
ncbi:unnamed protein product, partial [Amoebophrya sp. A120]